MISYGTRNHTSYNDSTNRSGNGRNFNQLHLRKPCSGVDLEQGLKAKATKQNVRVRHRAEPGNIPPTQNMRRKGKKSKECNY